MALRKRGLERMIYIEGTGSDGSGHKVITVGDLKRFVQACETQGVDDNQIIKGDVPFLKIYSDGKIRLSNIMEGS